MRVRFVLARQFLVASALAGIFVVVGCGGGSSSTSPSSPSTPTPTPTPSPSPSAVAHVTIEFFPTAPLGWKATLQGVTVTKAGKVTFDLPAGQYTMSGTTTVDAQGFGGALVVDLGAGHSSGGVVRTSMRATGDTWDGQTGLTGQCDVGFSGKGFARGAVPFTVSFTVTTNTSTSVC